MMEARPARSRIGAGALAFALALLVLTLPATAQAAPPQLWEKCHGSTPTPSEPADAIGECQIPRGIATDPDTGHLYVADQSNFRIVEFTAWGQFVKAWGWGVADGAPEPQTCGPGATPPTATCEGGLQGDAGGQLGPPQGVAVDSAGNVYVVDRLNSRVQKFDPEGNFLLAFGGNVNKTKVEEPGSSEAERNLCTAASADVCQAGTAGIGKGQFGEWDIGSLIAIAPDNKVYVGDVGRIQRFDTGGTYQDEIALPGEIVQSLAADQTGDLYVSLFQSFPANNKKGVRKLDPSAADPAVDVCESSPISEVENPRAIVTDSAGDVYVVDEVKLVLGPLLVRRFNSTCAEVKTPEFPFSDNFNGSTGIATNTVTATGGVGIYVSNSDQQNSFVRAYGPPPDKWPPPSDPPAVGETHTLSADSDGALVQAKINPLFWADTTYHVQYGTGKCAEGGCEEEQPAPPGSLLTGEIVDAEIKTASVFLGGLEPDTTYRYRFVAQSGGGGPAFGPEATFHTYPAPSEPNAACPNQAFRTGPSAKLPDCRAYEMVSPVEKNGGDVLTRLGFEQAAVDGTRMTFSSKTSFGSPQSAPIFSQYLASRDPEEGWSTRSISPPRKTLPIYPIVGPVAEQQFKAFSADLCSGWLSQGYDEALAPGAPPHLPNLYRRDHCGTEGYELLSTVAPPGFEFAYRESNYYLDILGFSEDGSRSVFRAPAALTDNAAPIKEKEIYAVYVAYDGGKLRLVSLLPNGTVATTHSSAGTQQGIEGEYSADSVYHAVSQDGSRIYWTANEGTGPPGEGSRNRPGRLYLRTNATELPSLISDGKCSQPGRACTIAVSEAPTTRFVAANPDGSKAIYATGATGGDVFGNELFEFDLTTKSSEQIAGDVEGVMGASEDLSRIYLVSAEVLSDDQENEHGDKAQPGKANLYLYETAGEEFTFIGTLSSLDLKGEANATGPLSPIAFLPNRRNSRVSPDGMHMVFTSAAPLSGYDNTDLLRGEPDAEVFHYDASTGELPCVSCNPSGARPISRNLSFGVIPYWAAATLPGWESQTRPSRALSEDGSRLFFDSFDALLPADSNGRRDVYQWEAPGSGDCSEGSASYFDSNGGCLSLISSGQSPSDSEFFDATPSGAEVFFGTQSSLLPQDPGLVDVYAAKEGGGFAPPPPPPPPCVGDACQAVPSPPNDPTPASIGFRGAGDPAPSGSQRCAKGKRRVVRAGKARCVSKKRRQRKNRERRSQRKNGRAAR